MKQRKNLLLSLFIFLLSGSCTNSPSEKNDEIKKYECLTVAAGTVVLTETYDATIRGRQDIEVFAQISGKITKLHVHEGERVKQGQLLFTIDREPYQAALRTAIANVHSAQAQLKKAQLEYNSKKDLFQNKVISEHTLAQSQNDLDIARANLEQSLAQKGDAANNLNYTEVRSPANGVVGNLPFRVGSLVGASSITALTTVSDNQEMYVYFALSESHLRALVSQYKSMEEAIRCMPQVELQLTDGSVFPQKGKVETISGVINPQTGTLSVRSVFPNDAHLLWSGGNGNVIMRHKQANVISIPQTATYEMQDKVMVYKVHRGVATATEIKVEPLDDGHRYVVRSGLRKGDVIIAKGIAQVQDGMKINVSK